MARFPLSIAADVHAVATTSTAAVPPSTSSAAPSKVPSDQVTTGPDEDGGEFVAPQLVYFGASSALVDKSREMRDWLTILSSCHKSLRNYVPATVDHTAAPFGTNHPKALPEPVRVQQHQNR